MKQKWFYFVSTMNDGCAKVNTESFGDRLELIGFRKCSYNEYLRRKKMLRDNERKIQIEGLKKSPGKGKKP